MKKTMKEYKMRLFLKVNSLMENQMDLEGLF